MVRIMDITERWNSSAQLDFSKGHLNLSDGFMCQRVFSQEEVGWANANLSSVWHTRTNELVLLSRNIIRQKTPSIVTLNTYDVCAPHVNHENRVVIKKTPITAHIVISFPDQADHFCLVDSYLSSKKKSKKYNRLKFCKWRWLFREPKPDAKNGFLDPLKRVLVVWTNCLG